MTVHYLHQEPIAAADATDFAAEMRREEVAGYYPPNTPDDAGVWFLDIFEEAETSTCAVRLETLSHSMFDDVRWNVAENRHTPKRVVHRLADDEDQFVAQAAVLHAVSKRVLRRFACVWPYTVLQNPASPSDAVVAALHASINEDDTNEYPVIVVARQHLNLPCGSLISEADLHAALLAEGHEWAEESRLLFGDRISEADLSAADRRREERRERHSRNLHQGSQHEEDAEPSEVWDAVSERWVRRPAG